MTLTGRVWPIRLRPVSKSSTLKQLEAGTPLLFGGNRTLPVPAAIAEQFRAGDSIYVVEATEEILLVPAQERAVAEAAVTRAQDAFSSLIFLKHVIF